jgi:adenine-specific DNA-methyltransferase
MLPTINFIGSKKNIVEEVVSEIQNLNPKSVLDAFSGSGSVSYTLKKKGVEVISNDCLYSNFVLNKAFIENSKDLLSENDITELFKEESNSNSINSKFSDLVLRYYMDDEVEELYNLFNVFHRLEENKKYLFGALLRRAMVRKMPYSRFNIPKNQIIKLRDEEYSYEKYKRRRAYHNQTFMHHILDSLDDYNSFIFKGSKNAHAIHMDVINAVDVCDYDVLYLDPPYPGTMNKYSDYYGVLDSFFGVDPLLSSNFEKKDEFYKNFAILLNKALVKNKRIVISCNTKSLEHIKYVLDSLDIVKFKQVEIDHDYKLTGKENKKANKEILIII